MTNKIQQEEFEGKNVIVTGGSGFVGSALVRELLDCNASVTVIEDFATGSRKNIEELEQKIHLIESDLSNLTRPLPGFKEVDHIFHLASIPSVKRSLKDPISTHRANVLGTLRLLEMTKKLEPESMIITSCSSVYGPGNDLPNEETDALHPQSPYAASKAAIETYARTYYDRFDIPCLTLRLFTGYGPRQDSTKNGQPSIGYFIQTMLDNEPPVIYDDGEQKRDFVHVKDIVRALLLASTQTDEFGQTFNVGTGNATSINELFNMIRSIIGREQLKADYEPQEHPYNDFQASTEKMSRQIGFEPEISLRDGLTQTVEWYQKNS